MIANDRKNIENKITDQKVGNFGLSVNVPFDLNHLGQRRIIWRIILN